jgi:hypothetical protein
MKCVILQPSYIPWRGYFHQIYKSDLFIFYDNVQYDDRGWRNRNRIKTPTGAQWLTIPVLSKGAQINKTPINQIEICWDRDWNKTHWSALQHAYGKAPFFKRYAPVFDEFYRQQPRLLADFTIDLTIAIAREIGIKHTSFLRASSLDAHGTKSERLLNVLTSVGATHYISGPSAKGYIEEDKFYEARIELEYMAYDYPEYDQLYPPYDPFVSILDTLFTAGPSTLALILGAEEYACNSCNDTTRNTV